MHRYLAFTVLMGLSGSLFSDVSDSLKRDVYRAILKHENWIITEHLESYYEGVTAYLDDEQIMTWDWSVRGMLDEMNIEEIQLDGKGKPEVIIQTKAHGYCGSGGCNAHILKLDRDVPEYLGSFFYNGEIKVIKTKGLPTENSHYDFSVTGKGGVDIYEFNHISSMYSKKH